MQIDTREYDYVDKNKQKIPKGFFPARVVLHYIKLEKVAELKNGLWLLYPSREYKEPHQIRFVVSPQLFDDPLHTPLLLRLENFTIDAVVRLRIVKAKYDEYDILNVEMLKPKGDIQPSSKLVFVEIPGKEAGSGAYERSRIVRGGEHLIFHSVSASKSGKHWDSIRVFLAPLNESIIIHYIWMGKTRKMADEFIQI